MAEGDRIKTEVNYTSSGDLPPGEQVKPVLFRRLRRSLNPEYDYTWTGEFWNACLCPPTRTSAKLLTYLLFVVGLWAALFSLTDAKAFMKPGGLGFSLLVLVVLGLIAGRLVQFIRLPPLFGMLIVGILLRNIPGVTVGETLINPWSSKVRTFALMVILTRAGLGLDPSALKRLSLVVIRLAFTPCLIETITSALVSKYLLSFPWGFSFMLGFILAAVSPAVVVPCLLTLQEKGLGVDKGIPTLVIAAASIDDVLAISGFGLVFGITFSQGGVVMQVIGGPLQAVCGVVWGLLIGSCLWYLPGKDSDFLVFLRFCLLTIAGCVALYGGPLVDFHGFGALATLSAAFVAGYGWGRDKRVSDLYAQMWIIFQPLLFGLIGATINIQSLKPETVGFGLATLAIGLSCRFLTTFFVVLGAGLSLKERLFVALAWLPKATVQAALASVVLDHAVREELPPEFVNWGTDILTIAVLVILITAPIGAIAIMLSAPKLLNHTEPEHRGNEGLERQVTQSQIMPPDLEMETRN